MIPRYIYSNYIIDTARIEKEARKILEIVYTIKGKKYEDENVLLRTIEDAAVCFEVYDSTGVKHERVPSSLLWNPDPKTTLRAEWDEAVAEKKRKRDLAAANYQKTHEEEERKLLKKRVAKYGVPS